jgi:hypothetical protein
VPVTRDSEGWSDVTPDTGSGDRYVYVSAAGSDSNDGLSTGAPKLTVAAGVAALRTGRSDQCLLRRGDTFTATVSINLNGRSATHPMVVLGAYGTTSNARPIINGGVYLKGGSHLVFQSIDFRAAGTTSGGIEAYDGALGLRGSNILVEDCIARDYYQAFMLTSGTGVPGGAYFNDVTYRRCVALDSDGGHGQGLFADGYGGQLTLEDFYAVGCGFPDAQSHCIYIDKAVATASTPILTRVMCWPNYPTGGGLSTTSEGLKSRQGMIASDCHVAYCAIGFAIGTTNGDGSNDFTALGTIQCKVDNCIVTYSCGLGSLASYGYGGWLLGIFGTGNYVRNCGFVHSLSTADDRAFLSFIRWRTQTDGQVRNVAVSGCVSYNAGKFVVSDLPANYSGLTFSNTKIRVTDSFAPLIQHLQNTSQTSIFVERQNNSLWSGAATGSWVSAPANGNLTAYGASSAGSAGAGLPDPNRDYVGLLADNGVTVANAAAAHAYIRNKFIAQCRYNWDNDYTCTPFNDHFRAGLGIDPIGTVVTPNTDGSFYYRMTQGLN